MENLKFVLTSIIVLMLIVFVGYWAFFTIEPGDAHVDKQKQKQLEDKNEELEKEVAKLKSEIALLEKEEEETQQETQKPVTGGVGLEEKPLPTTSTLKYQSLINDLQKLVDDNVFMKEKSKGTRVGTLQTFLNIYNKTSKKIDNDYGAGTKKDVMAFQKAEGLTADGEAGPSTFKKMIEWLKKQ